MSNWPSSLEQGLLNPKVSTPTVRPQWTTPNTICSLKCQRFVPCSSFDFLEIENKIRYQTLPQTKKPPTSKLCGSTVWSVRALEHSFPGSYYYACDLGKLNITEGQLRD